MGKAKYPDFPLTKYDVYEQQNSKIKTNYPMQGLEFIKKVEGGKVVIDIPEELNGKELRISISEAENLQENVENWHLLPGEKKLEILQRYQGTAKYPNVEINKHEVYDQ